MGRPSLGQAGRTVTASTKISKIEEAALIARHGTVHSAMRHALDFYMTAGVKAIDGAPSDWDDTVRRPNHEPDPADVAHAAKYAHLDEAEVAPCRIHKSWVLVKEWMDAGQRYELKQCMDCGYQSQGKA
jgi:hypothetical protein